MKFQGRLEGPFLVFISISSGELPGSELDTGSLERPLFPLAARAI